VCDLTGYSGTTSMLVNPADVREQPDLSRLVTVEFTTTVNGGRPWTFAAETPRIQVHPGQLYTVSFVARNGQDHAVVAQATPNILPRDATKYLKKTECFCFRQQAFAAGEEKHMPVRFMLDPELPAGVDTVTLSYTFFDATEIALRQ
jgi:cytochrome c oxidase assembly protein subunit 11